MRRRAGLMCQRHRMALMTELDYLSAVTLHPTKKVVGPVECKHLNLAIRVRWLTNNQHGIM